MPAKRRTRATTEARRTAILDAAEEVILERGYAAVSTRTVAAEAGMKGPHLYYYFDTIDDLLVAVLRRRTGGAVERMAAALESDEPLTAWWRLATDRRGTALFVEMLAAANHRPALKAEMAAMARDMRDTQVEHLEVLIAEYELDPDVFTPVLVAAAMQGLAFGVVADHAAGYETHPEDAIAAMDRLLARLEARRSN